jgi:hypothetical protein
VGKDIFNLPYDNDTPFYYTKEWLEANPGTDYERDSGSNKTVVYTIFF